MAYEKGKGFVFSLCNYRFGHLNKDEEFADNDWKPLLFPTLLALLPGLVNNESLGENGPPKKELHPLLLLVLPPVLFGR